jgi:aldehyde dehydrogenase (NAD+)
MAMSLSQNATTDQEQANWFAPQAPSDAILAIWRHLRLPTLATSTEVPCALPARSAINGEIVGYVQGTSTSNAANAGANDVADVVARATVAAQEWARVPAPARGELVRRFGNALRANKEALAALVTLEVGKVPSEGRGEVQEMIDICDFAVGLSRQLYGLTMPSERTDHRMMEVWHPLGVIGVVTAFNFPVAVWAWNAALALVCGNACIWKPSEKAPLTAIVVQAIFAEVCREYGAPNNLSQVIQGDAAVGEALVRDARVALVSATGSTRMGRRVGEIVAARLGRVLLELGGNNASIVMPSADLDLAVRAIAFGAMGTAGQRCTTLRRLLVHTEVYELLMPRLRAIYTRIKVGDPREAVLVGPLIDESAASSMHRALTEAKEAGAVILGGDAVTSSDLGVHAHGGAYVRPALVEMQSHVAPMNEETFAPILYVLKVDSLAQAMALNNQVTQGLSSSIFTLNMREAEQFLRASDCGIANVNMGPSGAEIGGAFGGEKDTGGGREAGSDAWKAYMRRATNSINYGTALPLAQGVTFDA